MKRSLKKVVKRLAVNILGTEEEKEKVKKEKQDEQLLAKAQEQYERAKESINIHLMDEFEMLYQGTKDVDRNINSNERPTKKANNVVNIVYDLLESEVDISIPQPTCRAKTEDFKDQAQTIEDSLKNDLLELEINRINDRMERTTTIQGYSILTVNWNPDFKHHLYMGEIEVDDLHPKGLVPQPGRYDIQKMDYFFLRYSMSKREIKERYGIEIEIETEEEPEINSIEGTSHEDLATVVIKWYKDTDGDIGKLAWCNDVVLEDRPKFFYRHDEEGNIVDTDVLDEDIQTSRTTIEKIIDSQTGEEVEQEVPVVIPAGTEIPYFVPRHYPVIIRVNVPVAFQFGGKSDVDLIRDQQDAIKKSISTIEEKIIKGGSIITALEDHNFNLTNELYQIVRGNISQLQALSIKNLSADIQKELQFAHDMYSWAQSTLGITNSFQGKADATATSGKAKNIQVAQAAGRLQSKVFNKFTAFKELFQIMFEFKLAYYDEIRPYLRKGVNNEDEYSEFNKYDFLVQDNANEYYYYTDFLFNSDGGEGLPKDKTWLIEQSNAYFQMGAIDKVQLWTLLESTKFPNASEIKKAAQEEKEQIQQQQQAQIKQQEAEQEAQRIQLQQQDQTKQLEGLSQDNQALVEENEQLKQMLQQYQEQEEIQKDEQDKDMIAKAVAELSPEQQQQLFSMPPEQQKQAIKELLNKGDFKNE